MSVPLLLRRLRFLAVFPALLALAAAPEEARRPVLIAHRGEHLRHPENTLESIAGAIGSGADYTEMDVRRSRDGVHLLMHDASVDRTTDGQGKVADLDWETLSRLKVRIPGSTNGEPARIPRLEEALEACKGKIRIYLDFKAGDVGVVAGMVRAAGWTDSILVYDSPSRVKRWREVLPGVRFILSPPAAARTNLVALERWVGEHRPTAVDEAPDAAFVEACRKLGVEAWPDVQRAEEGPDWWTQVLATGVRGFQTDHPAEADAWLRSRGER
jgi:glycerophosphoryl diester phosphodiesterase